MPARPALLAATLVLALLAALGAVATPVEAAAPTGPSSRVAPPRADGDHHHGHPKHKKHKKKRKKKHRHHPVTANPPTPPPVTPPVTPPATPASTTVYGANFGTGPDETLYQGRPDAARLYYQSVLPADLPRTAAFAEAYRQGVRTFVLSWKDPDAQRVSRALASLPDDVTVYGTYFHEPEDDIEQGRLSLAAWRSTTTAQAAVMRAHGVVPTSILMAFTVVGGKGRRVADYGGTSVDVFGFDYYPDKLRESPTTVIAAMAAASRAAGSGRLVLGEFGILTGAADGAALVAETRRALATARAEVACYWSQDLHQLSAGVADAWFGWPRARQGSATTPSSATEVSSSLRGTTRTV